MLRMVLPISAALVAYTPSTEDAAMRNPNPVSETSDSAPSEMRPDRQHSSAPDPARLVVFDQDRAALGPIPVPVSAAENRAPHLPADSPAEARGRKTISTGFVRLGPGEHLTVETHDGRVLVLRDTVMRAKDYCGVRVKAGSPDIRYCGKYADVATARPTGATTFHEPGSVPSNPIELKRRPIRPK